MKNTLSVLALEPYYGGSHKAFLDSWVRESTHQWDILSLPPYKWNWRLRHSPIFFSEKIKTQFPNKKWDIIFCSSMLDLATFKAFLPKYLQDVPIVIYFHENQLTYPLQDESKRNYQAAFTNFTSALAADTVWFNSQFNHDEFLTALRTFLRKMPDFRPLKALETIKQKSAIQPLGIDVEPTSLKEKTDAPFHITWAARWEHDKNPDDFFDALRILKEKHIPFLLSVIGEQFKSSPKCFEQAKQEFSEQIENWGYMGTRADYLNVLRDSNIIVSTAIHEFFGISILEGIFCGAFPIVPNRLAYPEVLRDHRDVPISDFFYKSTPKQLAKQMISAYYAHTKNMLWDKNKNNREYILNKYAIKTRVNALDNALLKSTK